MTNNYSNFPKMAATASFIFLLIVALFLLIGFAFDFLLLVFAGILFSTLLSFSSHWLEKKLKIKYGIALVIVLISICGLITASILLAGPSISKQIDEISETLPQSLDNLKEKISENSIGKKLLNEIPEKPSEIINDKQTVINKVTAFFSSALGIIANIAIVLITGIFLASNPKIYINGFIKLFPVSSRKRMAEVFHNAYHTLSLWLIAKFISMAIVGISTAIGLSLLGVPMAFVLALIAGLFAFIPNIGPYIALVPALLVASLEGNDTLLYVLILYFGIQIIESYLITPMIEKKMVELPPALTLFWQVLLGIFAGALGLLLATPILAVLMVFIDELYVKGYLEKKKDLDPQPIEN